MKIQTTLPPYISDLWIKIEDYYYNPLGLKVKNLDEYSLKKSEYFLEQEDNKLIVYQATKSVNNERDTIFFEKEAICSFIYNEKFNEIETNNSDDFDINQYDIFSYNYNKEVLCRFLTYILAKQEFEISDFICYFNWEKFVNYSVYIFKVFLLNTHKLIPLLVETNNKEFVSKMFLGQSVPVIENLNKKTLSLAKDFSISIPLAITLSKKFNLDLLRKFHKVLEFLEITRVNEYRPNHNDIIYEILSEMRIDNFSDFCNYVMRSIFITKNASIHIFANCAEKKDSFVYFNDFLRTYRDYLNLMDDENFDLYPDNLVLAHNAAIERHNLLQEEKENKKNEQDFKEATDEYSELAFCDNDWNVIIPTSPNDLVEESRSLHHCVRTYIKSVCNKTSKICLIRKNNRAYMTVEINPNNEIVQAKKLCNHFPDEEDELFLKKWCAEKQLTIRSY